MDSEIAISQRVDIAIMVGEDDWEAWNQKDKWDEYGEPSGKCSPPLTDKEKTGIKKFEQYKQAINSIPDGAYTQADLIFESGIDTEPGKYNHDIFLFALQESKLCPIYASGDKFIPTSRNPSEPDPI